MSQNLRFSTLFVLALASLAGMSTLATQGSANGVSSITTDTRPYDSFFVSGGRRIPLAIDWELRAVKAAHPAEDLSANLLEITEIQKFRKLGYQIYPENSFSGDDRSESLDSDRLVGVPIFFASESDTTPAAIGVLNDWIVLKTKSQTVPEDLLEIATQVASIQFSDGVFRVKLPSPQQALAWANRLHENSDVVYAHPDFVLEVEARTSSHLDEPYFGLQWNLENTGQFGGTPGADINVVPAWSHTYGTPSTIVANLDLGFEQSHPGMSGAWYVNPREIAGNKIDDDKNGFVDDVSGWNFAINGNNLIYGASNKHGTATTGIIGARMDGKGSIGICPLCTVLPLVVDNVPSNAAAAFYYAAAAGVSVISNSWGYSLNTPTTDVVVDAINTVALKGRNGLGTSIVFAMSNYARNDCRGTNPDISAIPSVIAVSSSDYKDVKTTTSAFGPCLKLVAPSSDSTTNGILTTDRVGSNGYNDGSSQANIPDADYTNGFYGTSAAAPQISGVIALLYSIRPNATSSEILDAVLKGADKINPAAAGYDASGHSDIYGYGRINAGKAMVQLLEKTGS